jgi:dihydrofolate reductase
MPDAANSSKGHNVMRKLIEYTLLSADNVFENPQIWGAMTFRDEAYLRDGLGLLQACDAMLMGRRTYETSAKIWPSRTDPWAVRLNAMKKYVFSSTLERADWNNSTIVRGDLVTEVEKLKQEKGQDLLIWGHGLLAESLLNRHLIDVLDLSIHPIIAGHGKLFFRECQNVKLKLVATKSFANIVKLTYEPQY